MTRDLLTHAAEEVDTAKRAVGNQDLGDRLDTLADQLRSQADRTATPALGTLDRVHAKLREIEHQTDDTTVTEALERARQDILSFLDTLDDRGMKQHGWSQDAETDDSA